MVEWSITAVLKTVEMRVSGGSNPSLCAKNMEMTLVISIFFCTEYREGFEGGSRFARAKRFASVCIYFDLLDGKGRH